MRPPEKWERDELSKLPITEESYAEFLGVQKFFPPPGYSALEGVRFCPTLELNGVGGGYQGEGSKTGYSCRSICKITCRLVPDQKADDIAQKVENALVEASPPEIKIEVKSKGGGDPMS